MNRWPRKKKKKTATKICFGFDGCGRHRMQQRCTNRSRSVQFVWQVGRIGYAGHAVNASMHIYLTLKVITVWLRVFLRFSAHIPSIFPLVRICMVWLVDFNEIPCHFSQNRTHGNHSKSIECTAGWSKFNWKFYLIWLESTTMTSMATTTCLMAIKPILRAYPRSNQFLIFRLRTQLAIDIVWFPGRLVINRSNGVTVRRVIRWRVWCSFYHLPFRMEITIYALDDCGSVAMNIMRLFLRWIDHRKQLMKSVTNLVTGRNYAIWDFGWSAT